MSKVLNVGVIGCGQIAQIMHLPYIQDSGSFTIHSLCDISKDVLSKLSEKYGVPTQRCFTDYNDLINDDDVDIVLICNREHFDPFIKAANAKKHILIEKPFAFNVEQADKMIQVAKENNIKVLVGYMKCYDPGFVYAAEKIKNLNDISLVRFHDFAGSFDYLPNIYDLYTGKDVPREIIVEGRAKERADMIKEIGEERAQYIKAYDNLLYLTVHDTVLLRHLFGNEGKVLFADAYHGEWLTAVLEYGKFRVVIESGLAMDMNIWDEDIYVYSAGCNLSVHFPFPFLKNAPTVVNIVQNENDTQVNQSKSSISSFDEAYRIEWQHFYDCIINDKEPLTSMEDGKRDIKLASDIIRAIKI